VSKKTKNNCFSQLRQISTNFDNFRSANFVVLNILRWK